MDPWDSGRPDVSHDPGRTGPQSDPVRWSGPEDERTPPPSQGRFIPFAVNSVRGKNLFSTVQRSYIDTTYKNQRWEVNCVVGINNKHLLSEYRTRVQEMRQVQRPGTSLTEKVMFTCVSCDKALEEVADKGHHVNLSVGSFLGHHKKGVSLSCHADIQLKVAELVVTDTCWIVMFKVALGNHRLITDTDVHEERVALSPDYDCHQFVVGPDTSQSIDEQASRNQVYIFEIDSDGVTSPRPRQVLPIFALKIKLKKFESCETVQAALAPEQNAGSTVPAAALYPDQRNQQTPEVNQTGVQNPSLPSCQYAMLSPLVNNSSLQNQQHPVAMHVGVQNQQHPVVIHPGVQNQQHPVAVHTGMQNQQHPVTIPSGLQNQQHPLAIHSGLQHPVAIQSRLHNQQHPVAIQSALQNQQHPVAIQPRLQNQQHPVAIQLALQNQQHPFAIHSGLQNQQHAVAIPSGLQHQQHPVAMQFGRQNIWNQVASQGGQQTLQHPAVNQAGVQNTHVRPTARTVLQNFAAAQSGYNDTALQWPRETGRSSGVLSCQLSDQPLGQLLAQNLVQLSSELEGQAPAQVVKALLQYQRTPAAQKISSIQSIAPRYQHVHSMPPLVPQDTQERHKNRGKPSGVKPVYNRETVQPGSQLSTHAVELSHNRGVAQSNLAPIEPPGQSLTSVPSGEPDASACTAPPDIVSPMGLGMRLPTVVPPTETEPVVSRPIQPIVIQPMSDVRPDFLLPPPAEPFSASISCDVETAVISSMHSQTKNPALWNLFSGGGYERQVVSARARSHMETSVDSWNHDTADDPALWNVFSIGECAKPAARTSAVSVSHEVETSPVVSSMQSRAQNLALWNLSSGSEDERRNTETLTSVSTTVSSDPVMTMTTATSPKQSVFPAMSLQGREFAAMPTQNRETSTATAVRTQNRPTAVPTQNGATATTVPTQYRETATAVPTQSRETATAMPPQNRETATAMPPQNRETATAMPPQNRETATAMPPQNRETAIAVPTQKTETAISAVVTEMTKTESASANCVGKILGTVSAILPDSDTHVDVRHYPHDLLIDDLDDVLPTVFTGVDDILGSMQCDFDSGKEIFPAPEVSEGAASQADSGIDEKSKEVSKIYVHEDGTVELVIERQVSSASDDDTGGDAMPCNDIASWQRFLSDKRFQPVVMLHKVDSVPHRPASLNHERCRTSEIQKGTSECAEVAACGSHSDTEKASVSTFTDKCLSTAACHTERKDQTCSTVTQNKTRSCPGDTERMGETCLTTAKNNNNLCPSNRSHESSVNLPHRVPCRPVMKASSKPSKPSVMRQHLGLPTKCKPCDRSRKHKVKAYTESDKASKRPCKDHISKPSEQSAAMEGAQKTHLLSLHSESNGVNLTKHAADAHNRSESGKHHTKKYHTKRHKKCKHTAKDSSHKRSKNSDSDREKKKHRTTMETARQTNSSEAAKEAVSLSSISVVIRGSQQRPFSPKSEAQKLSPMAKPWRPRLRASGEMPPMLKTMAAKLKHGRSHNMLATWQKSGKTTKTVFEPESLTKSRKNALVQKGDCVSPVAKASDHCVVRKPGEIRHRKARRNTDFGPLLHTVGEQQKTRRTSSAALVEMARRHSVDGDISNKTVFDRDHQRTVGLNRCKDISSSNWLQRSVQEPDGMRTSGTCQDTGRNVMGRTPGTVSTDKYPEDTAAGHTRGCIMKCAGLAQSPLLSADSTDSDHSAFTSVALPHSPGGDRTASVWSHKLKDTRTVHKTPSHESLALVLTEAWRRPTSQHAVGSSTMSLQGKGHPQLTKLAGKESLKQPLVGQNPWSRHGSGQRDLALAGQDTLSRRCSSQRDLALAGQDTRSRHGSGQGNPSLAGQDTRSRHGSGQGNPSLAGQDTRSRHGSGRGNPSLAGHDTWSRRGSGKGNSSLAGQETRSRHGSGQGDSPLVTGLMPQYGVNAMDKAEREHVTPLVTTALTFNTKAADATYTQLWDKSCVDSQTDPRLRSPDERSRIHPLSVADLCTVTPMIPFEQTRCETEHSDTDWGKLIPVNLSQDAWNTSDFCVACEMMSSITKKYSSKPPQERHQVMLVYSAKLKKTLQQSDDDEMFAESTSSMLSYSSTRDTHSPARRKKHLERQKLYKVLADIKTSVTADKVKIASMPLPDKEIHRRVDWSRLDCEIINERLGQWNRFHMDQQIQVLPQILRLSSESDKYISVEGQFLFMRVRPIQLGHCNELYALKVIIEAVYEELSLMSERGASDSRKDWLLLALGWLHTHRRQKLTEICHHDAQHVCELAELFQQRRAWYRKMQAELQKSPRQDSAISLLDDPLKYLARRIGTMTKYLEFIQNLSSCTYHAMSMNNTKDGISTCAKTLLQESAAQWAGRDKSVAVKPEAANMTRSSRDNIVRSVCLPRATSGCRTEAHGVDAEECCYDNADIDDICHKEAADHGEEGDTDGEFFSDHDFIEDIGHVEDSIEDVIDDESDKAEGPVKSGESGAKAACSENDADIIDAESDKSKESDESGAQHARCESNADIIDADIIDADIIDAESDMSKENGQSDIVATCSEIHVKESDDDIIEAENGRSNESEESDIVAAIRESESTENYNDVINGESDKLKENDQHEERDAKADCCQSDAKENDGDIVDDENDLSKGSSQCEESSVPTACSDGHGKENDDDTNFTEIAKSLQSLCEDSVVAADCCESRCKEDDDAQSDVPKRSEESDACHGSLFQESDSEVNSSSNSPGGNGHVEDIYDSENQVQRTVDDIKDADNTSGQCENQEIQNDLAETVRSVGKGDVSETEHSATEAGCHGGRSHGEEDEDPVNNTNCAVSQTDRHMEESSTTGDTTSQLRESESRLIESENSIYESISDVEDMEDEDDVCQEDNSVNIYCGRSNANIVEYVYHVVKSESMLRHAEDSISGEVRGENSKRNNGDVYTTSKHKVFQPNSCAEVKSIGVVLNMKSQVFCPEVKSIGVIMNGSVSHSGLAPDCSGRPCIEDMLASVEDSTGQAERVHMPTLCAIPREATIPSTTTVNQGTGSAAKKRKHNEKTKRRHREKRLRTDLVAVENDSPAVAERNVSKGTDDSGVRRYDDRRLSGFTGKSLSETQLHKSCYECNAVTNPAYYTNCTVKGHHRDGDTLRMKWQGDERPWSANDISSTHAMDRFFMSKNLHHNEAPWFDEEHGIHREPEGRGHRHRHRKDHKRHRHTRWEHSWKPH